MVCVMAAYLVQTKVVLTVVGRALPMVVDLEY